jgi:hypothetical protein
MIDPTELLAATGQLHGGAQAQVGIVDPEIGDGEPVEVDHVDHEPGIGRAIGGAADEDVHALDVGAGEQDLDAMGAYETGGAGNQGSAHDEAA